MSSLTYEVSDLSSPVAVWLRSKFPYYKGIQAAYRVDAGPARIVPSTAVATRTQGAAIDWWLRMLVDPTPSLALPLVGLQVQRVPCVPAGLELLSELGGFDRDGTLRPGHLVQLADRPDEWWARACYALALLVELYRAVSIAGSRLMSLTSSSRATDLLGLANDEEVADLIAMRDLARKRLLPALPTAGPVASGMTFEGSSDLAADADLIVGGILVEFKASQGSKPRVDGTRAASLPRRDLDQPGRCQQALSATSSEEECWPSRPRAQPGSRCRACGRCGRDSLRRFWG